MNKLNIPAIQIIILMQLTFLIIGCTRSRNNISRHIIDGLGNAQRGTIDLSKTFPFEWDTIYAFAPIISCDSVKMLIGNRSNFCGDLNYNHYMFHNGKLILHEHHEPFFDKANYDQVLFKSTYGISYWTKSDSIVSYILIQDGDCKVIVISK